MFAPRQNPYFYQHQDKALSRKFSLLCWNIHKENVHPHFHLKLDRVLLKHPSDFLLFQEYKMPKHQPHTLKSFSYAMAANFETKRHIYGLLTASCFRFDAIQIELTRQKEFLISTKKSILLTRHSFSDGKLLYLLNMHGINFVSFKVFSQELEKILSVLLSCDGAMIVCGDFNSWSKKRIRALEAFQTALSLEKAKIDEEHHIKHIFAKPIDHIFYRGVNLIRAEAIDTKNISDHNPIHATFSRL